MALYDYHCSVCNKTFEINHNIKESSRTKCPNCKKETLERLISKSNFILKGNGWYKDGYSNNKKNN